MSTPESIGWSREDMARRVAEDIPDGAYVNLGIGIPELVARFVPEGRELVYHTENGLLGMGPSPEAGGGEPELINAGKRRVTALPGASYFHQSDSFAMIRGGHLDLCVLGALQVSRTGDLANWSTGAPDAIPAVGGAMDLVAGVKRVFVITQHCTKDGEPKLVETCTYPLTGRGVVDRVYTDLAARCDYPLHLGLTEAGMGTKGIVASTAALSVLLQQGIGDTIRISLTPEPGGDRTQEVIVAQEILQSLGLRSFLPSVVACPGCGRTSSDYFQHLAQDIQSFIRHQMPTWKQHYPGVEEMTVAVMGCVVNGPGESRHANIGISLPGTGEVPVAPVYEDGEKTVTLKGDHIAEEFQARVEAYIQQRYGSGSRNHVD